MKDRFEQLVTDSQLAVCILATPELSDFELVSLEPGAAPENLQRKFTERGMGFVGVIGIVRGQTRVALDMPLDDQTASVLSQAFVAHVERLINASLETKGDSVLWCERLHALEDSRPDA